MKISYPETGHIPGLKQLWKAAFGDEDAFIDNFFAAAFDPRRCRCVLSEGMPIAMAYWFRCDLEGQDLAYLYAIATAEEYRGQGICRAMLADVHGLLAREGYAGTILVPGKPGLFRFYQHLGYETCSAADEFISGPAPYPTPLHQVDKGEYARLRRTMLPPGGVIQEWESLNFLGSMAKFYAGPGILCALERRGDKAWVPELLGPASAAPEILTALGCVSGDFRTPGKGKPFAMFRPLKPGAPVPEYFGLAFD